MGRDADTSQRTQRNVERYAGDGCARDGRIESAPTGGWGFDPEPSEALPAFRPLVSIPSRHHRKAGGMLQAKSLIDLRDAAIEVVRAVTYLEEFSSFPLDDGGAPVWILGRYHDVPREILGGHDHYLYAFNAAYTCAATTVRNFEVPEEAARFIAASNGIAAPQYRTVHHFFDHEHSIGWREGVRTAHEVAASLEAVVESLHRSLPSTWEYDEDTGRARRAIGVRQQVEDVVEVVQAWSLSIRETDLIEAIQDESLRAVHAANGAGFPPAREPSQLRCFWGSVAESTDDGSTDTGIRLDGVDYTLPLDTRRIVHAAWGRRGHSLPFIDAEHVHGKEITPGIAKRIQRNFNDKVTNSRWQMSLAGEQFTIQRIEEDVE